MELQDLGVMSGVDAATLSQTWTIGPSSPIGLQFWNKALDVRSPEAKKLTIPAFSITKVGAQVMSLGKFEANNEFVLAVGQMILEKGFEVLMGDAREAPNKPDAFELFNARPLVRAADTKAH
jgi:hypothetical protein